MANPRRPSIETLVPPNDAVSRELDEQGRLRRRLDGLSNSPWSPAKEAARERARSTAVLLHKAAASREAGDLAGSIERLRRVLSIDPSDFAALHDLGATLIQCGSHAEAIAPLQKAAAIKPDSGSCYNNLGIALEAVGNEHAAVAAYARAIALTPKQVDVHIRMGFLLRRMQRHPESLECFRRGAAAGWDQAAGRFCEAHVLLAEERFSDAAEALRRVLAREPRHVPAMAALGHVLAIVGDLDDAVTQFKKALALDPGNPHLFWGLVRLQKVSEADRPLVRRMEGHVDDRRVSDVSRVQLHFALGKAHDDLGEYEAAIRHYDAANHIRGKLLPFDRGVLDRTVDAAIEHCTAERMTGRDAIGDDDETPVFVIGMPRSGTTLVEQILSSHPQIAGAGEMPFWTERRPLLDGLGYDKLDGETAGRLAADYRAVLRRHAREALRVIDKTPSNFLGLGHIRRVFPKARFIHCRRHPIDTCLSIYFANFDGATGYASRREDLVYYYRAYRRLMAHWRAAVPADRFIEIDYEALTADPEPHTRRLVAFCGLDWSDACLRPEDNDRVVTTASLWQARQPIYRSSVARWKRYEPWLGALAELADAG